MNTYMFQVLWLGCSVKNCLDKLAIGSEFWVTNSETPSTLWTTRIGGLKVQGQLKMYQ